MIQYTIQEISDAWLRFTQPMWLIDNKEIDVKELKPSEVVYSDDVGKAHQLPIDYSRWIPYLVSETWRDKCEK